MRYTTAPAADPPEIDLGDADAGQVMEAESFKGIYRIEGDRLTICLSENGRPTAFEAPAGRQGTILITCHRAKKD
jgi:uncharacterized protein (TIGR03067 family)